MATVPSTLSGLNASLLVRDPKSKRLRVNYDPRIREMLHEAEYLMKLNLDVGSLALNLCMDEDRLKTSNDKSVNPLMDIGSYSTTSNNMKLAHWSLISGLLHLVGPTARRGLGGRCISVTAHPSTASVPITVLLYNSLLLCSFNVPVKGLSYTSRKYRQLNKEVLTEAAM